MKNNKRPLHGFIVCLLVTVCMSMVVGCGTQSATPSPNQQVTDKPKTGGTITVASPYEVDTLDVHKTTGGNESVTWNLGASLLSKDPVTKEYKPYLASSYKISEDKKTLIFFLRSGITFHDGTPLTAQSFKDNFDRIMDPKTKATAALANLSPVKNIKVLNDRSFMIELHEPNAAFLDTLSTGDFQPLSMKAIEKYGEDYGRNPVGVGPWKFESWKPGEGVTLVRNEDYQWGDPNFENQGPPRVDKLVVKTIPDFQVMTSALESGSIDIAFDVPAKDIKKYRNNPKYQVLERMRPGVPLSLWMNLTKPEFQDIQVRKAFNMLVNKQAMIQAALMGEGEVAQTLLSPATLGYDKSLEKYGYENNADEAKKLLDAAGWKVNSNGFREKNGKTLTLTMLTMPKYEKTAQLTQAMLGEVGIKINIQNLESAAWEEELLKGNFDVTLMAYTAEDPDVLYQMFHSSQIGAFNIIGLKDGILDSLLTKGRITFELNARKQAYVEAQKRLLKQAYIVPLYAERYFTVVNSRVKGVKWTSLMPAFNDSWVGN
ncbi:ABC transporter substrate-binding protein [Brevibacillus fluminis]|uniref:ABC transporter substrate-binding protein n=1 Tax=Brevibacillus fluminis TaxID=511487 RepID=A0A3M8CZR6_9BACL|nr:ABC transporter substrate-binding protein [Brevibacillus fluminis]RNB81310.1 ABC transporter substrate-binding protein [Brevibacillus fluminis]